MRRSTGQSRTKLSLFLAINAILARYRLAVPAARFKLRRMIDDPFAGSGDDTGTQLALADLGADPSMPLLAQEDRARVQDYLARASAEATLRAYRSDWRLFTAWCAENGYAPLPAAPDTVAAYCALLAERGFAPRGAPQPAKPLSRATVGRKLAAIVFAHRAAELTPPTAQPGAARLERVMRAIRRERRGAPSARKRAADGDVLRDMLRAIGGDDLRAARDRALLAVGMGGALRRSELVGIDFAHVEARPQGLAILIPHGKTDQEGRGATVVIPDARRIAPVRLFREWIALAGIAAGPVFRKLTPQGRLTGKAMSAQGVALVVKARAAAAGYDPALFSGHSLRAGFLTEAGRQGASVFRMKDHSRHKSLEMVSVYVREEEQFRDHAGDRFL